MRILIFALAAALAPSLAAPPALAADAVGQTVRQVTVRLKDLDLGSPAGARIAVRRLDGAAAWVCGAGPDAGPDLIRLSDSFRKCRAAALAAAVARAGVPALTQALDEPRGRNVALASR
jgi:UrcA family protein